MDFQGLLDQVQEINKKHQILHHNESVDFNIFKIMSMESNEVYTHSAMIGELLNPRGSHGSGDVFLRLFLNEPSMQAFFGSFDLLTDSAKVEVEKNIGLINLDKTEGGRIDILITDKNKHALIIENKIYAEEQPNQLIRYLGFANVNQQNFKLLYLTLDGSESCDHEKIREDYHCISYETHIISWLERCLNAATKPIVRETIRQYLHIVKELTQTNMSKEEVNELHQLIFKDSQNLEAAIRIAEFNPKQRIGEDLAIQLRKVASELELKITIYKMDFKGESGFWLYKEGWHLCYYVCFWGEDCVYGIAKINPKALDKIEQASIIVQRLNKIGFSVEDGDKSWVWHIDLQEWNEMPWHEVPNKASKLFRQKLEELKNVIGDEELMK